jgi:hypothetical protein
MVWPWSRKSKDERHEINASCGQFGLEVVGESHYQSAIVRASRQARRVGERRIIRVRVEREPTNPHDPQAVRIVSNHGETLGYLPRESASSYQKALMEFEKAGLAVTCAASLYGGDPERPAVGLYLDLLFPKKLRAAVPPPRTPK